MSSRAFTLVLCACVLASCTDDPRPLPSAGDDASVDTVLEVDGADTRLPDGVVAQDVDVDDVGGATDGTQPDADTDPGDASPTDTHAADSTPDLDGDAAPGDTQDPPDTAMDTAMPDMGTPRPPRPDVTAPSGSASWRRGGGAGYPDIVDPGWVDTVVVSNLTELTSALAVAQPGDIVYVDDDARIDLTDAVPAPCIPGGVWLASGRGRDGSPGALLYATDIVGRHHLEVCGDDVRITGLRIHGPDAGACPPSWPDSCSGTNNGVNCRDCEPRPSGIRISGHDRLEVDNNEIAAWSLAGVAFRDSVGNHVHHNDIHHNQREGLGYGVLLSRGGSDDVDVLVEFNRFDYNRHAIAGSGEPGQDYEARHNLVLEHANGHVFDMHGHNENTNNGSELAGGDIRVHANTILPTNTYALVVRGRPDHGSWLYDNCLARSASSAALQRFFFGNFHLDTRPDGSSAPNAYSQGAADCETRRWCYHPGGDGPQTNYAASSVDLGALGFGDFDGDGITDALRTSGGEWRVVYGKGGGWTVINTSSTTLDSLRIADLDGDGRDDLFTTNGTQWRMSSGGTSSWQDLEAATMALSELAFGDFDGDGTDDVFHATGSSWRYASGGTGAWQALNTSSYTVGDLGFGDFDGDGKTDVLSTSGGQWRVSLGGTSGWQPLNTSGTQLGDMVLGDFDGDGKTDVASPTSTRWRVSWGGSTPWRTLRIATDSLSSTAVGDFDGDGRDDLFRTGCY